MNKDLIAIFEYMEREKGISRSLIISAIEEALQAAAKKSVDGASNVTVHINPKTGTIDVFSEKQIVDSVENPAQEISLEEARELDPDCEKEQYIDVVVTPKDFGRIAARKARDIINQKIRIAEKDVIHEEYRHRKSELVSGSVKGFGRGYSVLIDLGKVEGHMPKEEYPRTEKYVPGDKVLALLYDVEETEFGGARVILSRSHVDFVKKLFQQEVPEIHDGTITIEKIVREAGYRTKITVSSSDSRVDPVGSCVGVRGNRIKNVIRELNHEKIDIVAHQRDPISLLHAVMEPIQMLKVFHYPEQNRVEVVVDDENYPAAIGKRGLNARLNGRLIDCDLNVEKITDYNRKLALRRLELIESDSELLAHPLSDYEEINKLLLRTLQEESIVTVRDLLESNIDKLQSIPGAIDAMNSVMENID